MAEREYDEDKIIEKIQKILALAEKGSTQEEKDLASEKAQSLMTQYAIEQARLFKNDFRKQDEQPIVKRTKLSRDSTTYQERFELLWSIARHNRCRIVTFTRPKMKMVHGRWVETKYHETCDFADIVGYKNDVAFVEIMFNALLLQLWTEYNRDLREEREYRGSMDRKEQQGFKASFFRAYADRIDQRLADINTKVDKAGELALYDPTAKLKDFISERYQFTTEDLKYKNNGFDAFGHLAGKSAADRADLGQTRVKNTKKELSS